MRAVDLIQKKRDGLELSKSEIEWLINGYVAGTVPDYQMSAFAMAIYFKGMTTREISDLTMSWWQQVSRLICRPLLALRLTSIQLVVWETR